MQRDWCPKAVCRRVWQAGNDYQLPIENRLHHRHSRAPPLASFRSVRQAALPFQCVPTAASQQSVPVPVPMHPLADRRMTVRWNTLVDRHTPTITGLGLPCLSIGLHASPSGPWHDHCRIISWQRWPANGTTSDPYLWHGMAVYTSMQTNQWFPRQRLVPVVSETERRYVVARLGLSVRPSREG